MSGSRKFNNKSNVIAENFKKFRQESGYSQRALCEKLELMGLQLFKADIYSIEHNKRSVYFAICMIEISNFYKNYVQFMYFLYSLYHIYDSHIHTT